MNPDPGPNVTRGCAWLLLAYLAGIVTQLVVAGAIGR